jgi:hypothetical protein
MLHSLAGVTIVTPDLDIAVEAYASWLGYVQDTISIAGDELAQLWGVPQAASAKMAVLRPKSGEPRFIRLIEGQPDPIFQPLRHYGWAAAEIIVENVDLLAERLGRTGSPFQIIGPPAVLDFDFTDKIKAMQVVGPAGEVLYLTEVDGEIPGFDLPKASSFVSQLFIMVLGSPDISAAADFYATQGLDAGPLIEARIDVLSHVHGMSADHRHRLTTVALNAKSYLEIDAFPSTATARPLSSIGLPCGISIVSFYGTVEPNRAQIQIGGAGEWLEILP